MTRVGSPVLVATVILFMLVLTLVFVGCDGFLLADQYGPVSEDGELTLRPSIATVGLSGTMTYSASGGLTPYRFSVSDDSLGTMNQDTGVFTANGTMGSTAVWVQDAEGSRVSAFLFIQEEADLSLTAQSGSIQQGQSTMLFPGGGAPPYHITIAPAGHDLVYEDGAGLGSISGNDTYNAGDSVGTVMIRVTDSADDVFDVGIEVVPAMPLDFDSVPFSNTRIDLTWYHNSPGTTGFKVERSINNGPYEDITESANLTITNVDGHYTAENSSLNPNTLYQYKVYAVVSNGLQSKESPPAGPIANITNP